MNPAGSKYQTSSYCCHVYARWMGNFGHASNDPYRSRSHPNKTSPHLHSKFARNVLMIRVRARGSVGIGGGDGIGNGAGRLPCVCTRRGQESVNRKRRVDCCILHATCFDIGCGLMRVMIVYVARFSNHPPIPIQISFIHHGGSPILRCHFWTSCSNETQLDTCLLTMDFLVLRFLCSLISMRIFRRSVRKNISSRLLNSKWRIWYFIREEWRNTHI